MKQNEREQLRLQRMQQRECMPFSQSSRVEDTELSPISTTVVPVSTAVGLDTHTQTVSSINVVPTPQIQESVGLSREEVDRQREQDRLDAFRTAATLRGTGDLIGVSMAP